MPRLIDTLNPEVAALLKAHPFQDQSVDIVANPKLQRMPKEPGQGGTLAEAARAAVGTTGHTLPAMPTKFDAVAAGPNDRVMPAFIIGPERLEEARTAKPMLPQREMEQHPIASNRIDGYVRFRVRVSADRMRILNVQTIEGPLELPQSIVGHHAYDVTLDGQRLSTEGIPDLGVQRSFPRPGQNEHHVTELPSFEFNVRVPRASLPEGALGRLQINLYRFPDATKKQVAGAAPLSRQLGPLSHVIAKIEGIQAIHLDPAAAEQVSKLFPGTPIR
jgi:hypothetical protein